MGSNPWLAMVAIEEPALPPAEKLAEVLRGFEPLPPALVDPSQKGKVVTFRLGEGAAAVTLFPMPIPWQHLEGPCQCAWYWPDAAETMRAHRAHVLVHLLDEGRDEIRKAMLLTQLTAAVVALTPAVGVVWGPGRLVHPPHAFLELARSMSRDELPLYLWIDFRILDSPPSAAPFSGDNPEEEAAQRLSLFTTGLETFGQREIEVLDFQGDVPELRAAAYNIAHYVLEKLKHIKDGETIGIGSGTAVTARRGPSMLDPSQEVLQLEF